jgi:four helix bundle protein
MEAPMKKFDCLEVALQLVRALREPLEEVRRRESDLASQARRAATSIALNISEGSRRVGRDRYHFFKIAAGSASEVDTALRVAEAWGFLDGAALAPIYLLLDRLGAMLYRLGR